MFVIYYYPLKIMQPQLSTIDRNVRIVISLEGEVRGERISVAAVVAIIVVLGVVATVPLVRREAKVIVPEPREREVVFAAHEPAE